MSEYRGQSLGKNKGGWKLTNWGRINSVRRSLAQFFLSENVRQLRGCALSFLTTREHKKDPPRRFLNEPKVQNWLFGWLKGGESDAYFVSVDLTLNCQHHFEDLRRIGNLLWRAQLFSKNLRGDWSQIGMKFIDAIMVDRVVPKCWKPIQPSRIRWDHCGDLHQENWGLHIEHNQHKLCTKYVNLCIINRIYTFNKLCTIELK